MTRRLRLLTRRPQLVVALAGTPPAVEMPARDAQSIAHAAPRRTVLVGDPVTARASADGVARSGPRTIALAANGSIAAIVDEHRRSCIWC